MKATRTALGCALRKCQPLLALFLALLCACTTPYLINPRATAADTWVDGRNGWQRGGRAVRIQARCIDWHTKRPAREYPGWHVANVRNSSTKVAVGSVLATLGAAALTMGLILTLRDHSTRTAQFLGVYDIAIGMGEIFPAVGMLTSGFGDACWTPEPLPLPLAASATASAG